MREFGELEEITYVWESLPVWSGRQRVLSLYNNVCADSCLCVYEGNTCTGTGRGKCQGAHGWIFANAQEAA